MEFRASVVRGMHPKQRATLAVLMGASEFPPAAETLEISQARMAEIAQSEGLAKGLRIFSRAYSEAELDSAASAAARTETTATPRPAPAQVSRADRTERSRPPLRSPAE